MLQILITGLLTGFIVGFLFKKISKAVIFIIILLFVLSQFMAFQGYISLDLADLGTAAASGVKGIESARLERLFTQNIPFSLAAIAGFIFGFKKA